VKYVGFGALVIGYWANVVLLHLVLTGGCPSDQSVAPPTPAPSPAIAALASHASDGNCRRGDEWSDVTTESGPMQKTRLVGRLNCVQPLVHACYLQYKVPGTAMVNIIIAKGGWVAKATVVGRFAGTPTGACVEAAVKTASFPRSDGLFTPYTFSLM